MDDTDDDARYPPNPYTSNLHQNFASSHRPKLPVRNPSFPPPIRNGFADQEDDEEEEDEDDEEEEEENDEEQEQEQEQEQEDEEEEEEDEEINGGDRVVAAVEDDNDNDNDDEDEDDDEDDEVSESPKKKRRLEKLGLGFEFVPRAKPPPAPVPAGAGKQLSVGRNSPADWSEQATFVLLDAWGDRFLQLGRKSLRSVDWIDVAKKVSHASRCVRTETQCRNRLDTLKKKYKSEKAKMSESGNSNSKWVYFKKLDMLMMSSSSSPSPPRQQLGLPCGLDSGEYVFANPRVYLNRSNGLDEMRDSPGDSPGDSESEDDDSEGLPPKRTTMAERSRDSGSSFRALADSIERFGEIYEKMENSKREQMVELEKMRMEFHRDLEVRKREIVERAQAEIAKIRRGEDDNDSDDDEEIAVSVGNVSG